MKTRSNGPIPSAAARATGQARGRPGPRRHRRGRPRRSSRSRHLGVPGFVFERDHPAAGADGPAEADGAVSAERADLQHRSGPRCCGRSAPATGPAVARPRWPADRPRRSPPVRHRALVGAQQLFAEVVIDPVPGRLVRHRARLRPVLPRKDSAGESRSSSLPEGDLLLEDRPHSLNRRPGNAVAPGRQRERQRDLLHARNRQCDQFGDSLARKRGSNPMPAPSRVASSWARMFVEVKRAVTPGAY